MDFGRQAEFRKFFGSFGENALFPGILDARFHVKSFSGLILLGLSWGDRVRVLNGLKCIVFLASIKPVGAA